MSPYLPCFPKYIPTQRAWLTIVLSAIQHGHSTDMWFVSFDNITLVLKVNLPLSLNWPPAHPPIPDVLRPNDTLHGDTLLRAGFYYPLLPARLHAAIRQEIQVQPRPKVDHGFQRCLQPCLFGGCHLAVPPYPVLLDAVGRPQRRSLRQLDDSRVGGCIYGSRL